MTNLKLIRKSKNSQARSGVLQTTYGKIQTPFFMPIATRASVKSLDSAEIKGLGSQIVLGNSYHLYLKPGLSIIKKAGGLHKFMNWSGPILTDSGGFQVFSLSANRVSPASLREAGRARIANPVSHIASHEKLVRVTDKGVEFKSVYDGSRHLFTPVSVIKTQQVFGSDIMMVLDQCVANPCSKRKAMEAMERTVRWAEKSIEYKNTKLKTKRNKQTKNQKSKNLVFGSSDFNNLLFCIVQGSLYKDLRIECAQRLVNMKFSAKGGPASGWDGYAIGGLAVGENPQEMYKVLDYTVPELPENKPRYLMGVGYPEQIIEAVKRGVDMFDCVIPTREARHGRLYYFTVSRQPRARLSVTKLWGNRSYQTISIKSEKFAKDMSPINPDSKIPQLKEYSKAYLRHLFSVNEPLALKLASLNNVEFYLDLMKEIRLAIKQNKL